jgi:hypothetical protein
LCDTYDRTRVWGAWNVGTMSEDDFHCFIENEERVDELLEDIIKSIN